MYISSVRQQTSLTLYGILNPQGYDVFIMPPEDSLKNPRLFIANKQIAKGNLSRVEAIICLAFTKSTRHGVSE
jgi:hypothetical protein